MADQEPLITKEKIDSYQTSRLELTVFAFENNRLRLICVSDGLCAMLGYVDCQDFEVKYHEKVQELVYPDDYEAAKATLEKAAHNHTAKFTIITRVKHFNRGSIWMSANVHRAHLEDNSVVFIASYADISEQMEKQLSSEKELIAANTLLDNILETTQTAIFWKDAQRRFLGANKAFLDYYGFKSKNEIIGKTDEDMGWHHNPDPYRNDEIRVIEKGESTSRVPGTCFAKGEERQIIASKKPMYHNNKIVGLVGNFEDVTQDYQNQKKIIELNNKLAGSINEYNTLMESTKVCILKLKLGPELSFISANEAFYATIGYTHSEYNELFDNRLADLYRDYPQAYHELHARIKTASLNHQYNLEFSSKFPSKQGMIWIKAVITFTDLQEDGFKLAYMVFTDISEAITQAERFRHIEDENVRLNRIIYNIPAGICIFEYQNNRPYVKVSNRYFANMIGLDLNEIENHYLSEMVHLVYSEDRIKVEQFEDGFFDSKTMDECDLRIMNVKNNILKWFHVTGIRVDSLDNHYIYVSFSDISKVKEAEKTAFEGWKMYEVAADVVKLVVWTYYIKEKRVVMTDNDFTVTDYRKFNVKHETLNAPESLVPLVAEESVDDFLELYRKVENGENAVADIWYKNNPGQEPRCERIYYSVVLDDSGKPDRAYGIGQNITAEKNMEARYQSRVEHLFDDNSVGIIGRGHHDLTNNEIIESYAIEGKGVLTPKDFTYDDLYAGLIKMAMNEDDKQKVGATLSRENLIHNYYEGNVSLNIEYQRNSDGGMIWVLTNIEIFKAPHSDNIECFIYSYDITNRVLENKILKQFSLFGYDLMGIIDAQLQEFNYYSSSQSESKDLIRQYDEWIKANVIKYVASDSAQETLNNLKLTTVINQLTQEPIYGVSYDLTDENGKLSRKQIQFCYLDPANKRFILFNRLDITKQYQKDIEQMSQLKAAILNSANANAAKSMFFASMSHDMRTPLNGIIGFTDLALKSHDEIKRLDYLKKIKLSGSLLLSLINDTLEISRIESGKMSIEPEYVKSKDLLTSVQISVESLAKAKNIEFICDTTDQDEVIYVDKVRMQEVSINILSNAVKFTQPGGRVEMHIERIPKQIDGCNYHVIFKDNGIGMSEEFIPKLFEPFTQEKREESKNVMGTGLGLTIVKQIIDLMNGRIEVESSLGKGTTINLYLPIKLGNPELMLKHPKENKSASLEGLKVLMCEDNYLNAEIAISLLQEQGMEVISASDGKIGYERFMAGDINEFDLILMDIRMPNMDGYEATKKIRSLERSDASRIPIIAMSADAYNEDIKRCLEVGMNGHIAKPINADKLIENLNEILSKQH